MRVTRVISFVVVVMCLLAISPTSIATTTSLPTVKTLHVAFSDGEPLFIERIIDTALSRMGIQMVGRPSGLLTAVGDVNSGHSEILAAYAGDLPEGYDNLIKIPIPCASTQTVAYTRDNSEIEYSSWFATHDTTVGFLEDDIYIEHQATMRHAILQEKHTIEALWDALLMGESKVVLLTVVAGIEPVLPEGIKKNAVVDARASFAYVNESLRDLALDLTTTLLDMRNDGTLKQIQTGQMTTDHKQILHISSYSSDLAWERDMVDAIKSKLPTDAEYVHVGLDARRVVDSEMQRQVVAASLRQMFLKRSPNVIIASDNDALEFLRDYHPILFRGTPIVFCGINNFSDKMLSGLKTMATGCTETISAIATVKEMLRLYPETKRIFVVNDYKNSGRKWQADIATQLERLPLSVTIEYNEDVPQEVLLQTIQDRGADTLVLMGSYYVDKNERYFTEIETQQAFAAASPNPIFALIETFVGKGSLGGMFSSAQSQGTQAVTMALDILQGVSVRDIPIVYASESLNIWAFDYNVANQYKIEERTLPEGHVAINKKATMSESFPLASRLLGGSLVLLLFALAGLLVLLRRQRLISLGTLNQALLMADGMQQQDSHKVIDRIEQFMTHAPLGFAIIIDGNIVESNEYGRRELGMTTGRDMRECFRNTEVYDKVLRNLETHELVSGESARFTMANGRLHTHQLTCGVADYDGKRAVLMFMFDVEEMVQQKAYILRTQEDLQRIIDALPTAMAIIETFSSQLIYANREFLTMYGLSEQELSDNMAFPQIAEQFFAGWQGSTVIFEHDTAFTRANDLHIKLFADQIVFRGKNCIVLMGQDITAETKRAEMLTRAAQKEREANHMKSVFLANMSHEIRTPMNAITGLSQLALMRPQTSENSDLFSKINMSSKNLLSIINDILDFSKIEAEKLDIIEEPFELEDCITNAFLVASERAEDKSVEILLDVKPDVPCYLIGDKTRLWQILKNLLDNAVKYTHVGRIFLEINVAQLSQESISLAFHVRDTGIGMTKEQLTRLFLPFEQFTRDNSRKAGTGLGMSITQQLVTLMQGQITVDSEIGKGTEFIVTLPFALQSNRISLLAHAQKVVGDQSAKLGTVLLVDDDSHALALMQSLLNVAGIQSECAQTTAEAQAKATEHQEAGNPYSMILIDFDIGADSGVTLATQLPKEAAQTKLLLATPFKRRLVLPATLEAAGIQDIIEKPFVPSVFLKQVCHVIPELDGMRDREVLSFAEARVLLCEDNFINQMVASGMLETFDIVPTIAENGQECIKLLDEQPFDIIFMDIIMPIMDGHEATRCIRESNKPYRNIPIVAMTANVMQDEVDRCAAEGMNGHIEKPIDIDRIKSVLLEFLKP